jgi:Aspartyl protease
MSLMRFTTSVSLAILVLPALYAAPRCPGNVASLTLRLVQGSLIIVPVEINHSGPYDFLVDTGAQITTVDSSLAVNLGLKAQGTTGIGGVATYARYAFANLDLLQAGTHIILNSLAVIQDLKQLKEADPRIRGILGDNFLEHFDILIENRLHLLCLDDSHALALAIRGEHVALVEPRGTQDDLPFTRPMIVSARLSAAKAAPMLLRLDSGSNAPVLYETCPQIRNMSRASVLRRVVNGVDQAFAVFAAQDLELGTKYVRQMPFVVPMNSLGDGPPPREDGILPTMAFQRVFISSAGRYISLDPW